MGFFSEMLRMLFNRPVDPVEGVGRFEPRGADFECSESLDDEAQCDRATRDDDRDPERPLSIPRPSRRRAIDPVEGRSIFRPTTSDFEGGHGLKGADLPDRDVDPELPESRRHRKGNGIDPIPD